MFNGDCITYTWESVRQSSHRLFWKMIQTLFHVTILVILMDWCKKIFFPLFCFLLHIDKLYQDKTMRILISVHFTIICLGVGAERPQGLWRLNCKYSKWKQKSSDLQKPGKNELFLANVLINSQNLILLPLQGKKVRRQSVPHLLLHYVPKGRRRFVVC